MTGHSPLGGSSAARYIACPGSVGLARHLGIAEEVDEEESDYAKDGTAAHEAAALCLTTGKDAWEVNANPAIQVYLDHCRNEMSNGYCVWYKIEAQVSKPDEHEALYGQVDFACHMRDYGDGQYIAVVDYKHGEGIFVEVKDNPQLMYYAYALLPDDYDGVVVLTIVQPRCPHGEPVRTWPTTAKHIREWAKKVLIPAMKRAEKDDDLSPGSHCHFCPRKLVCPALQNMARAAVEADPKSVTVMTDEQLGAEYMNLEPVRFYLKAVQDETFKRLMAGGTPLGTQLVDKKSYRVWKDGAEAEIVSQLGDDAFEPRKLKSPASLGDLGKEAKKLVAKYAFMPHNGYTVALISEGKPAVKVTSSFSKKGKV